ncbi:MAG: hypothetical protein M0P57_15265 [Syntrophales bacterium]|jgi:hypothetical protein|nr:hypothetical protein [Syntrophales bacterium]
MAETKFTKSVKDSLAYYLNIWLKQDRYDIQAIPEYGVKSKLSKNYIDVALLNQKDETHIVAIEIEVKSNPDQILLNRKKFKEWVHASPYRKGGMLHLIFSEANITQQRMYKLLRDSYSAISSGKGFYYEFMTYEADYRESRETARYLVDESWEFDARLLALINEVFE